MSHPDTALILDGIRKDDLAAVATLLARKDLPSPDTLKNSAVPPLLTALRGTAMADLLLDHGLTTQAISRGWADGFGLHDVAPVVADHLVRRGAVLTIHAAAALGRIADIRALLDADPSLIHAKGGDGGRPLHFARDVATAQLLVERGAELDPRDEDHDSTPAQWRIGNAPEITRFLLDQGARPDVFMAAGLGDLALAARLVELDPACTTHRIGNNSGPFPGIGFRGRGGTIYQWTLGFNQSPQEIAHRRGHLELFDFLMAHTPPRQQLLVACMLADRPRATALTANNPGLISELDEGDRQLPAKCCWETNLNREAVRLMLDLGFPVGVPEFNHGFSPLHNAAWCGDAELVDLLLARGHPVDLRDPTHHATALGFALHSCQVARRHPDGNFARVAESLLTAGVPFEGPETSTGNPALDTVLDRFRPPAS
ncbi:MAG: hypothetical protein AB7O66_11210 [Limisphaerales bacterium]